VQLLQEKRPCESKLFQVFVEEFGMNNSGGTENGQNGKGGMADGVLSSMTKIEEFDNDIWIGDSGASCHYCNNDAVLYDYTSICEDITVGNGNIMTATKMGKLQ
jgi:hypothetical protein